MSCIVQWSDLYCITRCMASDAIECIVRCKEGGAAANCGQRPLLSSDSNQPGGWWWWQTSNSNLFHQFIFFIALNHCIPNILSISTHFSRAFLPNPPHFCSLRRQQTLTNSFLRDFLIPILPRCVQWFDHVQCTLCIFCSNLERGTFWKLIWLLLAPISKIAFYVFLAYLFSTVSLV